MRRNMRKCCNILDLPQLSGLSDGSVLHLLREGGRPSASKVSGRKASAASLGRWKK